MKKTAKSRKLAKGVTREFTPIVRAIKPRRRPRGKPFPKENTIGLATRFQKGICPNPGGRPKTRLISESARKQIGADIHKAPKLETEADLIVAAQLKKARKGDVIAATFLADRAEGKPAVTVLNEGEDTLKLLVFGMDEMYSQLGRPEGMEPLPVLPPGETEGEQSEQSETQEAT